MQVEDQDQQDQDRKIKDIETISRSDIEQPKKVSSNFNMLSAFSHIGGDTLRTISVLLAAVVTTCKPELSGSVCDAWATIVVSFTIVLCVMPLMIEIVKELCNLTASSSIQEDSLKTKLINS